MPLNGIGVLNQSDCYRLMTAANYIRDKLTS